MKNTLLSGTIVVLIAIGAAGWIMYLNTSNQLSTLKAEIEKKEEKISKLKKENSELKKDTEAMEQMILSRDDLLDVMESWAKGKISKSKFQNSVNSFSNSKMTDREKEIARELNLGD